MKVPDGQDYIEFMLYAQLPAPTAREPNTTSASKFLIWTKALADFQQRPARQTYTRPLEIRTGINRKRQLNLFDPDGTRTELMESKTVDGRPALSSQVPAPALVGSCPVTRLCWFHWRPPIC